VRRRPGRGSKAALARALAALTADPEGCGPAGVGPLGAVVDCVVAARRLAGWSLWVELAGLAQLLAFWETRPPLTEAHLTDLDLVDPKTGELAGSYAAADPDLATQTVPAAFVSVPTGPGLAVSLTMTLSTWLGLAEDPAVLDRYGAVPAALARQIAREAARDHPSTTTWRCIVTGDDHRSVLAVADPLRTPHHDPPPRLARLVDTIHPRCVFPGCPRTARRCDHDHRIPYEDGGPTCSCNLQALCRGHHRMKSVGLITAQPHGGGTAAATDTLAWTTLGGRTYRYDAPLPVPEPADPHDQGLASAVHRRSDVDDVADIALSDDPSWRSPAQTTQQSV
jgi:hypothetical protein